MLKHFLELKDQKWIFQKPWLVLGKGPSFSSFQYGVHNIDYNLLGLNQVCHQIDVDITHITDWNIVSGIIFKRSKITIFPFYPHINNKPSAKKLKDLLDFFELQSREIYWYSSRKKSVKNIKPIIQIKYFSVEAAFDLLGHLGIKQISTLGIDGGKDYALEFKDLTPLTNFQPNFNKQFTQLNSICAMHSINWVKL